jgi:hypothetical protein
MGSWPMQQALQHGSWRRQSSQHGCSPVELCRLVLGGRRAQLLLRWQVVVLKALHVVPQEAWLLLLALLPDVSHTLPVGTEEGLGVEGGGVWLQSLEREGGELSYGLGGDAGAG